jgi:tRNA(adenine34) deaminase
MDKRSRRDFIRVVLGSALCAPAADSLAQLSRVPVRPADVDRVEADLNVLTIAPAYPDDPFVGVCIREAIAGSREGSGGIGACLVREDTGEIVERGHNRQFTPHFRSDLHAEMDLLDRYEDRVRILKPTDAQTGNPRRMYEGLALYSSYEPCPMCMTRILNTGIKRILYAAPDPEGGMTSQIALLPPFWRQLAAGTTFAPARCSTRLAEMARVVFGSYTRRDVGAGSSAASGGK